jgi:hypothetical protein
MFLSEAYLLSVLRPDLVLPRGRIKPSPLCFNYLMPMSDPLLCDIGALPLLSISSYYSKN